MNSTTSDRVNRVEASGPRPQLLLAAARCVMEMLESRRLLAGVDVLSYHGGTLDSNGVNNQEVQLTPGNVIVSSFGKQFTTNVMDTPDVTGIPANKLNTGIDYTSPTGQVYAEPLVKTGVTITAAGPYQNTVHDVVFVATQMDSLFAIDANGGTVLWKDSFIHQSAGNPNPLNAAIPLGVTACPGGYNTETNSQDISPYIGIVSTPVIDGVNGYIYLTAKTREVQTSDQTHPHYIYRLHKIRLSDGLDSSVLIGDTTLNSSTNAFTFNSGPYVLGTGDGATTVGGQSRIYFNAVRQMNRPALELYNGRIYTLWGSHGDNQPYHGWVLTFDAATLALNACFNATPNGSEGEAGIWQGGGAATFDSNGNLYFETGNGKFDGFNGASGSTHTSPVTGLDANGFPVSGNYGDCFLKLALDPTTTQGNQGTNLNGWGLKVVDYFSPYNNSDLDATDKDLGSGAPIVLPDSAGSAAHPHLLVGAGKEGKLYLIDRDNMGKFSNTDAVVQTVGSAINGSLDTPAYFNGRLYYTAGYGGSGASWQLTNGTISTATLQNMTDSFGFPGSSPYITANGTLNGIAWMIDKGSGQLRAYNASDLTKELWNSSQNAARDALGSGVKFAVATPVNGRVYAGTAGFLVAYGPPVPPTAPPTAPTTLKAVGTGASTIYLTWTDTANNEDGFKIERSSNGINFTEVGATGVNVTTFTDSGLSSQATYYYRVRAYNSYQSLSYSGYTNVDQASTSAVGLQSPIDLYHFDEGAGTTTNDSISTNHGTLIGATLPGWISPGRVGSAALSFSGDGAYNKTNESAVQLTNDLSPILGGTSSLAAWIKTTQIGNNTHWQAPAITGVEQAAAGNDINWGSLDATGRIGLYVGDSAPIKSTNPINDGLWHHVAMSRDAATGVIKLYVDGVLNATATSDIGAKTSQFRQIGALTDVQNDGVTITGSNYFNGQLDDVRIYNQVIDPAEVNALALPPTAPTNLAAVPASGTELDLTWTDNATTETGYKLERSVNGGPFVQIPQLPANTNSYIDSGLTQGTPYAYRVRATNTAGDSAYSNTFSISTPVPPVTPSNGKTTLVTTHEIDMTWTDNATNEDGYRVFRRTDNADFAQIATLPPNSHSYNDTGGVNGLTPGINYDYHIQAYNIAGYSDFVGFSVSTVTNPPTGLAAVSGNQQITLNWTAPVGAVTYNIYRGTATGGELPTPIATGIAITSFNDIGLTNGKTYFYQVTAVDTGGESAKSTEASATPYAAIANRAIFYNNSLYDGNDAAANAAADNAAIAPDKSALLPGQAAVFANYTSYDKGINGLILDIANLPAAGVTAADFAFFAGNTTTPGSWAAAPAPASVTVFRGAGVGGSDRIELIWADYSIRNQWLQVTVNANAATTGLATADTFYFGNLVGKTAATTANATVSVGDVASIKFRSGQSASITSPYDLNRDGQIGIGDVVTVKFDQGHVLAFPFTPPAPPAPSALVTMAAVTTAPARAVSTTRKAASPPTPNAFFTLRLATDWMNAPSHAKKNDLLDS